MARNATPAGRIRNQGKKGVDETLAPKRCSRIGRLLPTGAADVTHDKAPRALKHERSLEIVATHPPVHPGSILRDMFLAEYELTPYALAKACHMHRSKVERIVREDLGISGDTAVRFGRFFGNSAEFWMNLQATYEVMKARQEIGAKLNEIQPLNR
jgi:addiction module HigA family antidote